jgi:MFS family permease
MLPSPLGASRRNRQSKGVVRNRMGWRAAVSGTFGTSLEYFDFQVYGLLSATVFPRIFFSELGDSGALLASFATFGVGFVSGPLGGVVFGHLGDKFGRRPVLFATLVIMALSSVAIGLLPINGGVVVVCLLVLLRFIGGFSVGGETSANQLMALEHAAPKERGLLGAVSSVGTAMGQILANLVLVGLTSTLSEDQWLLWGWRVPFLFSVLIIAVAAFIRLKLDETPAFVALEEGAVVTTDTHEVGFRVLRAYPQTILRLVIAFGGISFCFYLAAVYSVTILTGTVGISTGTAFIVLLVANMLSAVTAVLGGVVSDKMMRRNRPLIAGIATSAVGVALFFLLVPTGNVVLIASALTLALCAMTFYGGIQPAVFAEQFPTQYRFSGSALAFTLSTLIGATAPFVSEGLGAVGGNFAIMAFAVAFLGVSAFSLINMKDHYGIDLTTFTAE